jgi:hypothetical protein
MQIPLGNHLLLYDTHAKYISYKCCKFCWKYPDAAVPYTRIFYKYRKRLLALGSSLDSKSKYIRYLKEKLDGSRAKLVISPRKSFP